jgi:flagellar biosynthesis GTPase FlhF
MPEDKFFVEIKEILKEITEKQKELRESQEKTDEEIRKLAERQEKTDEEIRKLIERQEKTDEEIRKLIERQEKTDEEIRKLIERQEKTDEEIRKLTESQKKTDKEIDIDKVNKMVGDLTDGWGEFVVGLFEPSVGDCIRDLGFEVIGAFTPSPRRIKDKELEVDLLAISKLNGEPKILVIEVKSSINQQKIDEIENKLLKFKEFFFEYKDIDLIGGVAGVRFPPPLRRYALTKGLYIFSSAKGIMRNLTPKEFQPKIW